LILPAELASKTPHRYQLTDAGRHLLAKGEKLKRLSSIDRDLLDRLNRRPKGLTTTSLRHGIGRSFGKHLSLLKRRGLIQEMIGTADRTDRRPAATNGLRRPTPDLNSAFPFANQPERWHPQSALETAWWQNVLTHMETARPARFLLQGSHMRRLSVAFEAIDAALKHNRRAIVITPDIARAEMLAAAAGTRWYGRVGLFHSSLPPAIRKETRQRIQSGAVSVVVGTRSAVFAPMSSIGLIYIDDEESGSFKEETEPRYHVREVAWMRAQMNAAVVLLGSAHPSLETMHALGSGLSAEPITGHSTMTLFNQEEPREIQTIDLRQTPYGTLLSDPMIAGIRAALEARAGVILFLNRKGFAPALLCRDCGHAPQCPKCSVALTFYKEAGRLSCHYCGASRSLPDTCPMCHAPRLQPGGVGTEAVEEWSRRLFPQSRIGRIDTSNSKQAASIRRKFIAGKLDLLIGTQMLCQGEPALSAGFVGLIQADAGLHLPDFRAGEHTYHTLMDAIALARPKHAGGRIVLQTLLPTHYVIQAVTNQDPALFYRQELALRQALAYPPFTHLISLRVSGASADRTKKAAEHWAEQLLKRTGQHDLTVWGPIPSAIAKLREAYRWQIVVKSTDAEIARQSVQKTLSDLESRRGRSRIKFEVDVDPITML
jgi:primosomal protein N' (replication factor Y)